VTKLERNVADGLFAKPSLRYFLSRRKTVVTIAWYKIHNENAGSRTSYIASRSSNLVPKKVAAMNHRNVIIASSLLLCAMAGPARADIADTGAADAGAGQGAVFSLLDQFAADSQQLGATVISETALVSSTSKSGAAMGAYYSVLGSNDKQVIASTSAAPPYFIPTIIGTGTSGAAQTPTGPGLAALSMTAGGIPVGSGAVVSGESVAPLSSFSSSPIETPIIVVNQSSGQSSGNITQETPVPIPLPFFLAGSGLAALLGLKRRQAIV